MGTLLLFAEAAWGQGYLRGEKGRVLPPESQHLIVSSIPEPNLGEDDEDKDLEPGPSGTSKASAQISGQSDTDITAEFLQPLLTPDNVANLVRTRRGLFPRGREEGSPVSPCLLPPDLCLEWAPCYLNTEDRSKNSNSPPQ